MSIEPRLVPHVTKSDKLISNEIMAWNLGVKDILGYSRKEMEVERRNPSPKRDQVQFLNPNLRT